MRRTFRKTSASCIPQNGGTTRRKRANRRSAATTGRVGSR